MKQKETFLSLGEVARQYGFSKDYFARMKHTNPKKYAYIASLDDDFFIAFGKFKHEYESLFYALEKMFFDLEQKRKIYQFSQILHKKGFFKHTNSYVTGVQKLVFKADQKFNFGVFVKYKNILNVFEEVKNEI
ncbi:MAG TPA: hypothetical protein CFH81_08715 [Sulfurovum sp. UBA12169]|nr:MAG TPA: hypothetical protein CFH81_08715 [Sulfurovum sp. UBA12169]